jgi:hypothetical protein
LEDKWGLPKEESGEGDVGDEEVMDAGVVGVVGVVTRCKLCRVGEDTGVVNEEDAADVGF